MAGDTGTGVWKHLWESATVENVPWREDEVNKYLIKYADKLLPSGGKLFVPMCGKALELKWLYDQGYHVVGVEFFEDGVRSFFDDNGISPSTEEVSGYKLYMTEDKRLKIYVGDFFNFNHDIEGGFDGVWDRGALGSIDPDLRERYSKIILDKGLLSNKCNYLVEGLEYECTKGPPYTLSKEELKTYYGSSFHEISDLEHYEYIMNEQTKSFWLEKDGKSLTVFVNLYLLSRQ